MRNKLMIEEFKSLVSGKQIQLMENPNIFISGDDLGLTDIQIKMILDIIDTDDFELINMCDILSRYNNSEYWDNNININE